MSAAPTIENVDELALAWAQLLEDADHPDVTPAAAGTAPRVRYELRFIKSTGAVVPYASFDTLAEARAVAARLVEVGTPPPLVVEVQP